MKIYLLAFTALVFLGAPQTLLADSFESEADFGSHSGETFRYDDGGSRKQLVPQLGTSRTNIDVHISNNPWQEDPQPQASKKERKQRPERATGAEPSGSITRHSEGGDYAVTLNGCSLSDDHASCQFTITNSGKVRRFSFGYALTAKDDFGNEYRGKQASHAGIGKKIKRAGSSMEIESAMSDSAAVEFTVTPNASEFSQLRISIRTNEAENFTFSRVPLLRR